jgi:hypothetical protein
VAPLPATDAGKDKDAASKPKPAVAPSDTVFTDKFGSYKLSLKGEGKYTLTVLYEKLPASIDVFSYKEPTRYDFILEKKDGKLSMKRK